MDENEVRALIDRIDRVLALMERRRAGGLNLFADEVIMMGLLGEAKRVITGVVQPSPECRWCAWRRKVVG